MVGEWKKQAAEGLASVFSGNEAVQDRSWPSEAEVYEERRGVLAVNRRVSRECRLHGGSAPDE